MILFSFTSKLSKASSCGVVVNVLDCEIVVSKFKLQLRYYEGWYDIKNKESQQSSKLLNLLFSSDHIA